MNAAWRYTAVETDAHSAGFARVLAHSFARTEVETAQWLTRHARSDLRVLTDAASGRTVAGLIIIPMGQYFGGRSVPMHGVAGVGVAPEARGQGAAPELMRRTLREMRESGVPISGLYPAAQKLYRAVGYEQAGSRFEVRIPAQAIGLRRPVSDGLVTREMEPRDREAVTALYSVFARANDGNLDRGPLAWDRIERPPPSRTDPARVFVIEGPLGLEGYIYLNQQMPAPPAGGKHEVHVHDMAAATPAAALALWSFLGGYASLATDIIWHAGPAHPLLAMLPEQPYRMTLRHHWMLRIVDIAAALRARGYPAGVRASLRLEVSDAVLPSNSGGWLLEIAEGKAGVENVAEAHAPASPTISVSINALASIFSGFFSARSLKLMGALRADDRGLAAAELIFPCGSPWMSDMF